MPISYGDTKPPKKNTREAIATQFKVLQMDLCLLEKRFMEICKGLDNVEKDRLKAKRSKDVSI